MLTDKEWVKPTPAQAEAGNYFKPTVSWRGLTIKVENPAGSVREGKGWKIKMVYDYGYVSGTEAVDGDEVDVYLGPSLAFAPTVYVVHQRKYGDWERYDEDKCMLGFLSEDAARHAYLQHYNDPRFLGPITAMHADEFVAKVRATKDKPAMIKALLLKTHVSGYTRKDGTVVPPHEDSRAQSLHDDIERQEKWLQGQARGMGYRDIEHLLESDYPAFERLAAQWREENPVEVALKSMVLFFKAHVGAYLRGGRIVSGYQGRDAKPAIGQMSLFGGPMSGAPLPPSPLQGKDAVAHTPDMFTAEPDGELPQAVPYDAMTPEQRQAYDNRHGIRASNRDDVSEKLGGGRVGPNADLHDGTTIRDAKGNQFRVHYMRNSLIVAHPIVDGRAQVSATTTVRFWTNPDQTPAGENDRTDPVFVVEAPLTKSIIFLRP